MSLKIIDDRGRITLSKDIRKQAGLEIGDIIKVIASPQVITLRKVSIVDVTLDDVKSDIASSLRHLDNQEKIILIESILKTLERN